MDAFLELMFYLIAAPFWIAWKILVFFWTFVLKPLTELVADHRTEQLSDQLRKNDSVELEESTAARKKQIAHLIAEANTSVPEKMRALIRINETMYPVYEQQRLTRWFAEDSFVRVRTGERTGYAVDTL